MELVVNKIKNNMPLLSIIIPAYNAAEQIGRCLGSILNSMKQCTQNYSVEVIVVNDGSLDNTVEKVNTYINDFDGKLSLINKENGGVSSARNCGIQNAHGKYLYFMDSDDEISIHFFEVLLSRIVREESDVYIFGFTIVDDNKRIIYLPNDSDDLLNKFLLGKKKIAIWSIVCISDLFKTIRFDEQTYYAEDIEVISRILVVAKKIEVINEALYVYYMDNPTSAMHKKISVKNLSSIAAHQRIYFFLEKQGVTKRTLRSASNLMLSRYYIWKKKVLKTKDADLINKLSDFKSLDNITPRFQLNKFYFYNIICYCRYHFTLFNK